MSMLFNVSEASDTQIALGALAGKSARVALLLVQGEAKVPQLSVMWLLGGVLLGGAEALWSALFPIEFRDLAIFVLLVMLVMLRPSGLFGVSDQLPKQT